MVGPTLDDLDGDAYAAYVERKDKGKPPPVPMPSSLMPSSPTPSSPELKFPDFKGSKTCRLLLIPAELRTEIFQYALTQDCGEVKFDLRPDFVPERFDLRPRSVPDITEHAFSLTETCSQIRRECGDMVYEFNTITFYTDRISDLDRRPVARTQKFQDILAKQMQTQKLKAVKFHLGALVGRGITEAFGPVQSPLRKLRKIVRTLHFACTISGLHCEFGTDTAQDTVKSIRDALGSGSAIITSGAFDSHSMSYIIRCFFPFWTGTI